MWRRKLIIFIIILLILATIIVIKSPINRNNLSGKMILSHSINKYFKNSDNGIVVYNPQNDQFTTIIKGTYDDLGGLSINPDQTKLLIRRFDKEKSDKYHVCEFDLVNYTENELFLNDGSAFSGGHGVKYLPGTDNISYILNNTLYIYDRNSLTTFPLLRLSSRIYSWDNTGTKIIYNNTTNEISIYGTSTKTNTKLLDGADPLFSNNNEYIAYVSTDGKLTVYNTSTKEHWSCEELSDIYIYAFSPDNKYLAVEEQYTDLTQNPHYNMYVINFKTRQNVKLFSSDGGIAGFEWVKGEGMIYPSLCAFA